jgi:hypothetical protein
MKKYDIKVVRFFQAVNIIIKRYKHFNTFNMKLWCGIISAKSFLCEETLVRMTLVQILVPCDISSNVNIIRVNLTYPDST